MARATRSNPNVNLVEPEPVLPLADLINKKPTKSRRTSSKKNITTTTTATELNSIAGSNSKSRKPSKTSTSGSSSRRTSQSPGKNKRLTAKSTINTIDTELASINDTIKHTRSRSSSSKSIGSKESSGSSKTRHTVDNTLSVIGESIKPSPPITLVSSIIQSITPTKPTKAKKKSSRDNIRDIVSTGVHDITNDIRSTASNTIRSVHNQLADITRDADNQLPIVTIVPSIVLYVICLVVSHICTFIAYSDRIHNVYHSLVQYIPRQLMTIDEYHHYNIVYYIVGPLYLIGTLSVRHAINQLDVNKLHKQELTRHTVRIVYSIVTLCISFIHYTVYSQGIDSVCQSLVTHDFLFNLIELVLYSGSTNMSVSSLLSTYITLLIQYSLLTISCQPTLYHLLAVSTVHHICTELIKLLSYVIQPLNSILYALYTISVTIGAFILCIGITIHSTVIYSTIVTGILVAQSFLSIIDSLGYKQ